MDTLACYLTFDNTHHALMAEKAFKEHHLPIRLVPIPRQLSASCGLAAEYSCDLAQQVEEVIRLENLQVAGRHRLEINPRRNFWQKYFS